MSKENKKLLISIITSKNSWLNSYIKSFIDKLDKYIVSWVYDIKDIKNGDIAFFLSFEQIVSKEVLIKHKNNIVVHGSALPNGKGMSPITWQILEGKNKIPITLFEMVEKLDSGEIYLQDFIKFNGTELVDEIREQQANWTFKLCLEFLEKYPKILQKSKQQQGEESFYKRRNAKDSELDINKTIAEQFNLFRVVDNDKYPAFFEYNNEKYFLKIKK
jgi:methionyl-tRNA formyltransferase